MVDGLLFSVAEASQRTGVAAAKVRYYVETYCDFLGLSRAHDGQWKLTAEQMNFVAVLAGSGAIDRAIECIDPFHTADSYRSEWNEPTGSDAAFSDAPRNGVTRSGPTGDEQLLTLTDRIDDLSEHLQDLSEETKQVQILLSRIISLLDGSSRPLPASVRPWEPPDLTLRTDAPGATP